jgi:hypothetical protein
LTLASKKHPSGVMKSAVVRLSVESIASHVATKATSQQFEREIANSWSAKDVEVGAQEVPLKESYRRAKGMNKPLQLGKA